METYTYSFDVALRNAAYFAFALAMILGLLWPMLFRKRR
jgi:hypothetical protein